MNYVDVPAKDELLSQIRTYCHQNYPQKTSSVSPLSYAGRIFDEEEVVNLIDSALEFWLTNGRYSEQFERDLAKFLGVTYCSFVNSGSSANLLAFMALTAPELGKRAIQRGDEVITVACGFPTTVAPIVQYGAVPVFVDVEIPTYNIDVTQMENALSSRTKAVMIAHTLGNPFDLAGVKAFCDQYNLWLVEDNCDSLGAEFQFDGIWRKTGTIGDIGTSSFYPAHHITTGEGGAVYTNNPELHSIIRSLRDWGRACTCPSGQDNTCGHRFDGQFGTLPQGYDHKYVYSRFGYNLKATDMQAAIGVAQLKKLPNFIAKRNHNFQLLKDSLVSLTDTLILPKCCPQAKPSWFGFPVTCRRTGIRGQLVRALESAGIQTRMLFAGNLTRHPCLTALDRNAFRTAVPLEQTDRVAADTFWVGVYPGLSDENVTFMAEQIKRAVKQ
ncbi:lipopolysaccharide biosynthesis protein RfbH [Colidextribacter sp. OB.20]|uniref:lipopolysaccharide biosynthesis protein RfbH n=1 Tax=Colidextribacter sp. OB.20 TaxID=2304568 RepID=UPI001368953A|nr:lipopolysaccharide biosynthesis protein RfbH [Colidextribacter sp. OB.20]NBI08962.1 lipopolysaccharide biosynthesis protein RfbH [Colidextribacter sp. OB.20]